jgi:cytochrome c553
MVFKRTQVTDLFYAPDWFPDSHPPMPDVVARGRQPDVYACGYCHLPDGKGRPENASLAGLPAAYIVAQVADFRSGARRSALRGPHRPNDSMLATAQGSTDEEVAAAAEYFSKLPMTRRVEVIEATRVPQTREIGWLYVATAGAGTEPLGLRIIEMPLDHERHELRDPASLYRAYVPRGSVMRGRDLAERGGNGLTVACVGCHGADLRGSGLVPPLAGRSPTYILRQLLAFRTGARASVAGQPMLPVVAQLSVEDMVAVAAYAASRAP